MSSFSAVCDRHPERPALARCVDCGRAICAACSTRWEGLHLCVDCLARRRDAGRVASSAWGWLVVALLILGLAGVVTAGRTMAGVLFWTLQ